jgi:hypothetical protein
MRFMNSSTCIAHTPVSNARPIENVTGDEGFARKGAEDGATNA